MRSSTEWSERDSSDVMVKSRDERMGKQLRRRSSHSLEVGRHGEERPGWSWYKQISRNQH